ncbi:MAG: hypothetical protein ACE5FL_04820 [Myxococcota bacterium]
MIRRIVLMSFAVVFASFAGAKADDVGGEDIVVPPPAVVVDEAEESVTAPPPPYVSMESTSVAAGIGLGWGEGTLLFEGQRHPFSLKSLSLIDLGVAKLISEGSVENLDDLADFDGTYVAVEAGASAGLGVSAVAMRNQNGVVIRLTSDVRGVNLALGPEGLRITLD